MVAAHSQGPLPQMTEAAYLTFADAQPIKHEYRAGRVYAMAGASVRHNTICANLIMQIGPQFAQQDCTVTSSDTRVHIARQSAYRYPDVTVFCGDPAYLPGRRDTITNPLLLIEVLSPGAALHDYNEKLEEYTQIDTLHAYVLVTQHKPKVELFHRQESGKWLYEYATGLDAMLDVPLPGLVLRLPLTPIYRRVQWEDAE